jgi:hypothetical protein
MTDAIYPTLPTTAADGENFRLHKVNMVLSQLSSELKHYEKVRKKYARSRSITQTTAVISGTLSAALTSAGIGTSLTGPGVIVGVPLSAIGGISGLVSALLGVLTKRLTNKISKHEKTIQLIKAKHNSIADLVSKALHNNSIDEQEFSLIMTELDKYEALKNEIRHGVVEKKTSPAVDIQKLREEIRKEFLQQLQPANKGK